MHNKPRLRFTKMVIGGASKLMWCVLRELLFEVQYWNPSRSTSSSLNPISRKSSVFKETTIEVDLLPVIPLVLGRPGWLGDMLKFPMRIGLTWSDRIKFQPTGTQLRSEEVQYEVQAFEKVKTPKGEFNAFKLVMTMNAPQSARPKARESHRSSDSHLLLCSRCQSYCFI